MSNPITEYDQLHARKFRGEKIDKAEWGVCGQNLREAAEAFKGTDLYKRYIDRANECDFLAGKIRLY